MILRIDRLLTELPPPSDPDPRGAAAVQELMGGKFGEMSTFMGSTAMGVLLRGVAELRDDGCAAVVLVTSPGITRRALEVSGVLALFGAYATRAEAVAAVGGDQPLADAWRRLQPAT